MLVVGLYQTHRNEITELVLLLLVCIKSVTLDLHQAITYENHEWKKENVIITFLSYIRIALGSCVRLTLGSYVIKPPKWDQKIT